MSIRIIQALTTLQSQNFLGTLYKCTEIFEFAQIPRSDRFFIRWFEYILLLTICKLGRFCFTNFWLFLIKISTSDSYGDIKGSEKLVY